MNEKKTKLYMFSGSDWRHRGGKLVVVAKSVADAARLLELARRAKSGAASDKMAEPVDKVDVGRNSRWINEYFYKDDNFRCGHLGGMVQMVQYERSVWHAEEDGKGMYVEKLVRLV